MKAMVLYKPMSVDENPLVYTDVDVPKPEGKEVLIKISKCGVCRTDLHIVEGELPPRKLPVIPGHQIIGYVVDVGENVEGVSKGDRVGLPWLYKSCGVCKYCRRGLENLCENALFTGYSVDGGYAEYVVASADFVHKIPSGIADEFAAPLMCAGAIGYRSLKLTGLVERGEGVLGLFGYGAAAHLVLQIAKKLGLTVYVFTSSAWKIGKALENGADWAGKTDDSPPKPLDAAIVYAPVSSVFIEALKKVDRGGRVVLAEIYMSDVEKLPYSLLWHEREVKSVANVTRRDVAEVLQIASKHRIRPEVRLYPLKNANEALKELKHRNPLGQIVLDVP
ncbi:zinc-dependent alcohol dehydrogenase family protein [Ignisphaera sp. 4213-co]|uniref:Zinc-dependent alcohol dehydrogenase family protein n=1 Tax=Ignisphaera cupida TaxID=3050454 RepID=A0ABD4Z8A1_9CREN|nr:zinc-dependent alcohol dehydrogenase family protein [Ignisphaera sp. 4213-co]MDK6028939.1 zinc-dependent alcohol dehydrogenase family protein [Ignisphaera sp. 4213-co]